MTHAQLPKGIDACIKLLRLCLDAHRHVRSKGRDFNIEEREEWSCIDDIFSIGTIAVQFSELDKDTSDYIFDLQQQYAEAIHTKDELDAKERRKAERKAHHEAERQRKAELREQEKKYNAELRKLAQERTRAEREQKKERARAEKHRVAQEEQLAKERQMIRLFDGIEAA